MAKTKNYDWKFMTKLVIGLFCMFGFRYVCPTWADVTPVGVAAVGIFIGVVLLMSSGFGLLFPSIIGMFAMQMTGFYNSDTIVTGSFGSGTIYQLIIIYALCQALLSSGAADVIARWFISRKFTKGRPMLFTFMFLLCAVYVGAVLEIGGVVFYYALLEAICKQLGYDENGKWYKRMVMGVNTCTCVGFPLIPFKGLPLLIFGTLASVLSTLGYTVNYAVYMLSSLALSTVFVTIYVLIMRFVWKVDMSKLKDLDVDQLVGEVKMNRQQAVISIAFVVAILYPVIQIFLPADSGFAAWYNSISTGTWFGVILAALCIIRVDGKPVVNGMKALSEGVDWGIIFSTGMFSLLGSMISNPDMGIRAWLNGILSMVVGNMPFPFFLLLIITITVVVTNFFSSAATGIIVSTLSAPFLADFAASIGINPSVVGCAIVSSAMFAYLTMAASGTSPLFLAHNAVKEDNKLVWGVGSFLIVVFILISWMVHTCLAYIL